MKKQVVSFIFFLSIFAISAQAATSASQLCKNYKKKNYFKKIITSSSNRLTFKNKGGLLNGGVCWWHSRFTRNAIYLATFSPQKDRPTQIEIKKIIRQIRKGSSVVEIPGYQNLEEFSYSNQDLIQKELEKWQIIDGFVNQQWIVGLWGSTSKTEKKLKKWMDKLFKYVSVNDNIAYQKLQMKGIDAHAWLVYDMDKTRHGYKIKVIDSNSYSTRTINYTNGDTSIYDPWYGNIIPYTGRKLELKKAKRAIKKFCK
jgi:hypothetical protein